VLTRLRVGASVGVMDEIRLRGPADVVAVLPYQLGYHPQDSIVVVALRDRAVALIERIDVPRPQHVDEASRTLVVPLLRERPEAVMLVGYESRVGSSRPTLDALRGLLTEAGLLVLDRLVVRDGRWFALDCLQECCPAEGAPVRAADSPAVAEMVGLEVSPLARRGALADLVAADPDVAGAVAAALAQPPAGSTDSDAVRRLRALSRWSVACDVTGRAAAEVEELTAAEVALLVTSLDDLDLRDGLVAWLCPGSLPLDCLSPDLLDALRCTMPLPSWHRRASDGAAAIAGRRLLARLQALARSVPDDHAAGVLTVLANLAWWQGDGALARTCLDRALESAPDYRLARLLERMVDLGVRPGGYGDELPDEVRAG
jgi:hypothetical protein